MKVLVVYDYPPTPEGLSTQGDMLYRGLLEHGVEAYACNHTSSQEKEWYYHWFKPDVVVGIGYWGDIPTLVMHPQQHGIQAVPWLVADGYIANYQEVLNSLPLILVTSNWVKEIYERDGISGKNIEVLPVGCDTNTFAPIEKNHIKVRAVRNALGVADNEIMVLTAGGDAASKGAQEVMQALAIINPEAPDWKYICKVYPAQRTERQNMDDLKLAQMLGIDRSVTYTMNKVSRNFMPYLLNACDIYAAPSRIEGFGMIQVEAGACEKPVIGIKAMAMLDTMIHRKTALLADVASEIYIKEASMGADAGFKQKQKVVFPSPRIVDYRASVHDIADYLLELMKDPKLRASLGKAARQYVVEKFDYKVVAKQFIKLLSDRLGIS
ncbi:MAG: glycosyltransferase family 4 protein [Candidatus Margulisbacteria bacterium]|nr:glycosyltransferase family 4 protein [Candidatus Margulisiibacteriota bacterium]